MYTSAFARAQRGDAAAMEKLVRDNDALVHYVVKRLKTQGREYEDLYQLGRLGLVRAVRNFDESYGVKFSTYAVPMIMGEIRRFRATTGRCACRAASRKTRSARWNS